MQTCKSVTGDILPLPSPFDLPRRAMVPGPRRAMVPGLWRAKEPGRPMPPPGGHQASPAAATAPAAAEPDDRPLICAQCLHPVARDRDRLEIAGAHRHVFANPYGLVFEIGCFAMAPGCAVVGPATADCSWFPGSAWRIAACASCGAHLGWRYEGHSHGLFFGLILPRLRQAPPQGSA